MSSLELGLAFALVLMIIFALREAVQIVREVVRRMREDIRSRSVKFQRCLMRVALIIVGFGPALFHGLDLAERVSHAPPVHAVPARPEKAEL